MRKPDHDGSTLHRKLPEFKDLLTPNDEVEPGVTRTWQRFSEISRIPRKSREEQDILSYIKAFAVAEHRGGTYEQDDKGNLLVSFPATPGYEDRAGLVIQCHADMVCRGEDGADPAVNGVKLILDETGRFVKGDRTTLGADNGIGLAAALSLLDDPDLKHGPIHLLVTVEEEIGMLGARNMSFSRDLSSARYLLNFDTQRFGDLLIGSAGGGYTEITYPFQMEPVGDKKLVKIEVSNLLGGHSANVIGEGRKNGIKVLGDALAEILDSFGDTRLVGLKGGKLTNAIPEAAEALIAVDSENIQAVQELMANLEQRLRDTTLIKGEKGLKISATNQPDDKMEVMTKESTEQAIQLIQDLPHGVISEGASGIPQLSTNLATVRTDGSNVIINMMSRAQYDQELATLRREIKMIGEKYRATVTQGDTYPGWVPNYDGGLIDLIKGVYQDQTGMEMHVGVTLAGKEPGAVLSNEKFSHLIAASFGPTIIGEHTTSEMVDIASVTQFYKLAQGVIAAIYA